MLSISALSENFHHLLQHPIKLYPHALDCSGLVASQNIAAALVEVLRRYGSRVLHSWRDVPLHLCSVLSCLGPLGHFITMQHIAHAANKTRMAAPHVNDCAGVPSPAKGPAVSSYSVTAPSPAHASVAPTPSAATASTPVQSFLKAGAPPPPPQVLAGHPRIVQIPSNLENVRFLPAPYFPWRCDPLVSWVPRRHDTFAALKLHVSACVWAAGH